MNADSPIELGQVLRVRRGVSERLAGWVFWFCAFCSFVVTFGILVVLLNETLAFFEDVTLADVLFETTWSPVNLGTYGIWPLINGTLMVTSIGLLVALPFGLLIAIYLAEYASPRMRKIVKPTIEVLAGIPTVVFGFFALMFVTPLLADALAPFGIHIGIFNALSAGIVMGIMVIPTIASLSEDALYAVPRSLREASYALGGTKLRTIVRVVLPTASSGIIAAVILGISRAVGETMIVTIAAGASPRLSLNPTEAVQTMTAAIVELIKGEIPHGSTEYRSVFFVGMVLFMMTLALNMAAHWLRRRYQHGGY